MALSLRTCEVGVFSPLPFPVSIGHASDVWALGCILYELCALRHAFGGRSMTDLLQHITTGVWAPGGHNLYPAINACTWFFCVDFCAFICLLESL